jgi:hypothetical protein
MGGELSRSEALPAHHADLVRVCVLPHQILTQRLAQLAAVRKSWLYSLLTKLAGAMIHGSLHLAIAPQRFPRRVGSYFPHPALESADLQRLIESWGETLQFTENVSTAPFGVGNQSGDDLLPLSFKGVFVGAPPAQDPFSPLLLSE